MKGDLGWQGGMGRMGEPSTSQAAGQLPLSPQLAGMMQPPAWQQHPAQPSYSMPQVCWYRYSYTCITSTYGMGGAREVKWYEILLQRCLVGFLGVRCPCSPSQLFRDLFAF